MDFFLFCLSVMVYPAVLIWRSTLSKEARTVHEIAGQLRVQAEIDRHYQAAATDVQSASASSHSEVSLIGRLIALKARVAEIDPSGDIVCYTSSFPITPPRRIALTLSQAQAALLRQDQRVALRGTLAEANLRSEHWGHSLYLRLQDAQLR